MSKEFDNSLPTAKADWIDFGKFVGILFVLFSHAEINIPLISGLGNLFYIAIFFVIAGYTYHYEEMGTLTFAKKKATSVLIPYFSYSFILYVIMMGKNILTGNFDSEIALASFAGIFYSRSRVPKVLHPDSQLLMNVLNAPLWFLTAFFISFMLFHILLRISHGKIILPTIICVTVGVGIHYFCPVLLPWSLDTAFLFEGMFAVGYFYKKMEEQSKLLKRADFQYLFLIGLFISMLILQFYNGAINLSVGDLGKSVFGGFLGTICGSFFILLTARMITGKIPKLITGIGQSSLHIMALHLFFFEIFKVILEQIKPGVWTSPSTDSRLIKIVIALLTMFIITFLQNIFYKFGKQLKREVE